MDPLITIEIVPISIEYVEKKTVKASTCQTAQLQLNSQKNHMTIKSQPISLRVDSFESNLDFSGQSNLTYQASVQFDKAGKLILNHFSFQQFDRGIDHMIDHLPENASNRLFQFEDMQISFDVSHLPSGMPTADNLDASFLPPDLELKVLERPKVIIKYVGGPIYIPRSADPNYDPPEYLEIKALDAKA